MSWRLTLAAVAMALIAGCSSGALQWEPDTYVVRDGDTLYSIAFRHGLDHRELARWNDLGQGRLIYPGQVIRLVPPSQGSSETRVATQKPAPKPKASASPAKASRPASPRNVAVQPVPRWRWPTTGPLLVGYGERGGVGEGISIGGKRGDAIVAAAEGRVVYSGSGLIGYGKLIIVKHNDTFLSAYGHNDALYVEEGDLVKPGQRIAAMGEGPGRRPVLHFEIRLNGEPVNPLSYLPQR
ncbi:MAG: peptidoglycan DD-metalloendopeptidase family protein [Chromatiales bacterium]|nr:peptidoglycan DD-metalloendopeptidase family protein [Chromatiales bacterium]